MKNQIILMILLLIGNWSFAQSGQRTPQQRAESEAQAMRTALQLDSTQHRQIMEMLLKQYSAIDSIKSAEGSFDSKRQHINMLYDERLNKLQRTLTPFQFQQYQQTVEAIRNRVQNRQAPQLATNKSGTN